MPFSSSWTLRTAAKGLQCPHVHPRHQNRHRNRRDAVELPGAMRWVARRVRLVHHVLSLVIGLLPEQLARCIAEMGAVRTRLDTDIALRTLRTLADAQLRALPAPLGFHPHRLGTTNRNQASQHKMGPDPPPVAA